MRSYEERKRGKKIKVHESRALPGQDIKIDIRIDDSGVFSAHYLETWYESRDLPELRKKLDAAVASNGPTEWTYYIQIDDVEYKPEKQRFSRNDRIRLVLDYEVLKLSNKLTRKARWGEDETYRLGLRYEADAEGNLCELDDGDSRPFEYKRSDDTVLVEFTPERWRALDQIRLAVEAAGERLATFLNGSRKNVAAFLDDTGGVAKLLPPALLARKKAG